MNNKPAAVASSATHDLAELNIAKLRAPIDSPQLASFVSELDRVNALAESQPGFKWRLISDVGGNVVETKLFGEGMLVNLSTWSSIDSLKQFVYGAAHADIMRQRRQWFEQEKAVTTVLWWVDANHRPTLVEAKARLDRLRHDGPGPDAFTFKDTF